MDIEVIKQKEQLLNDCTNILKQEFIGIDSVIDQVMNNIKTWYIYPELLTRPIVINLWGMTGCGKTSLVSRICELLNLNDNKFYYNLAKLGEESSEDLEYDFDRVMLNNSANSVFVFDEFQFAASISSDHKEKEPITALKTIWEIIDSGKIIGEVPKYLKKNLNILLNTITILESHGAKFKDNKWINSKTCFNELLLEQKSLVIQYFNVGFKIPEIYSDIKPTRYWCDESSQSILNNDNYILSCNAIGLLFEVEYLLGMSSSITEFSQNKISKIDFGDLYDYIKFLLKKLCNGIIKDYSKSLVFVMGNIDEAYHISYNMDPDMDPDQFNAITKKLTIVDIKEALQERFRNEQISRLGNIMIIYPSFSKKNFEDIIALQLDNYSKTVKENLEINLTFDSSIYEVIYKDGVFPTQGTRPIFTSIYEIVQNKLGSILIECINNKQYDIDEIHLYYSDLKINYSVYHNGLVTFNSSFDQVLRIEHLRNIVDKEQQILTAIHESGHFVMYSKLTGNLPAKLVSATASTSANGFMLENEADSNNYMTYQDYLDSIKIDVAGYVAELLVFGKNNVTSGASADLKNATVTASKMVRAFNMFDFNGITTYLNDSISTEDGMLICETEKEQVKTNKLIGKIINDCKQSVINTLNDKYWRQMFVESCMYLKNNIMMTESVMEEMYNRVPEKIRETCARKNNRFENLFDKFIQ